MLECLRSKDLRLYKKDTPTRRVSRERGGERSSLPFSKIWKKCPNLEKLWSKLWSSIGKIYHLKLNLLEFPGKKAGDFCATDPFFLVYRLIFIEVL